MGMHLRHAHAWMDGLVHVQLHTMAWDLIVSTTTTTTNNRRRDVATWMLYYNACMSMRAHGNQETRVASSSRRCIYMYMFMFSRARTSEHNAAAANRYVILYARMSTPSDLYINIYKCIYIYICMYMPLENAHPPQNSTTI